VALDETKALFYRTVSKYQSGDFCRTIGPSQLSIINYVIPLYVWELNQLINEQNVKTNSTLVHSVMFCWHENKWQQMTLHWFYENRILG
jgi:hypothetical protein